MTIFHVDNARDARSYPERNCIFVKPPKNLKELMIVLHELGHVVLHKTYTPRDIATFRADFSIAHILGIISARIVDEEAKAWVYALGCVNTAYHSEAKKVAAKCLDSYVKLSEYYYSNVTAEDLLEMFSHDEKSVTHSPNVDKSRTLGVFGRRLCS